MRAAVVGMMIAALAITPANAERFAIACTGTEMAGGLIKGETLGGSGPSRKRIYVIDEEARTVQSYDSHDRDLSPVCVAIWTCETNITPERVTVRGTGTDKGDRGIVSYDWDRATGRLESVWELHLANGNVMALRAELLCKPTKMPRIKGA